MNDLLSVVNLNLLMRPDPKRVALSFTCPTSQSIDIIPRRETVASVERYLVVGHPHVVCFRRRNPTQAVAVPFAFKTGKSNLRDNWNLALLVCHFGMSEYALQVITPNSLLHNRQFTCQLASSLEDGV
jgi:hypothetical protein